MCSEALFYFGANINKFGYPKSTCLRRVQKNLQENAVPYTVCCALLAINSLWIFIINFCMLQKTSDYSDADEVTETDKRHQGEFDEIPNTTQMTNIDISARK